MLRRRQRPAPSPSDPVVVTVEAGPDSGRSFLLRPGRHVVGRTVMSAISLADDLVEAHHAVISIGPHGSRVARLSGRTPLVVDAVVCDDAAFAVGSIVEIGASRLRFGPVRAAGAGETGDPSLGVPVMVPDRLTPESRRVFAEAVAAAPRGAVPGPTTVRLGVGVASAPIAFVSTTGEPVAEHALAFELLSLLDGVRASCAVDVRADIGARDDHVIAVRGAGATGALRSMLGQLVRSTERCDVVDACADATVVGGGGAARCDPGDAAEVRRTIESSAAGDRARRLVVVTDAPPLVRDGNGAIAAMLRDAARPVSVLVALPDGEPLPSTTCALLDLGARWRGRWVPDVDSPSLEPIRLHVAGRCARPRDSVVSVSLQPV